MLNVNEFMKGLNPEEASLFSILAQHEWTILIEEGQYVLSNRELNEKHGPFGTDQELVDAARYIYEHDIALSKQSQIPAPEPQMKSSVSLESSTDESLNAASLHQAHAHEIDLRDAIIKQLELEGHSVSLNVPCNDAVAEIVTADAIFEIHCGLAHEETDESLIDRVLSYEDINSTADLVIITCCHENLEKFRAVAEDKGLLVKTYDEWMALATHEPRAEALSPSASPQHNPASIADFLLPESEEETGWLVQQIHPAKLRTDGGTQSRASLDPETVEEYKQKMLEGAQFPAVKAVFDGKDYWLAAGFHRQAAALKADVLLDVKVKEGTRRDAILISVQENTRHGLRRSNADKRRAVLMLLFDEEWTDWSDGFIAKTVDVSRPLVGELRSAIQTLGTLDANHELNWEESNATIFSVSDVPESLVESIREFRDRFTSKITSGSAQRKSSDGRTIDTSNIGGRKEPAVVDTPLLAQLEQQPGVLIQTSDSFDNYAQYAGEDETKTPNEIDAERAAGEVSVESPAPSSPTAVVHAQHTGDADAVAQPPQPAATPQKTAERVETKPSRPTIEEMLDGGKLSVSFTWMRGVKGRVSVSVNTGNKPETALRELFNSSIIPTFPEQVMRMIESQLKPASNKTSSSHKSKEEPAPKVDRIIKGIKEAETVAGLEKVVSHFKLDNRSRFSQKDSTLITKAVLAQRKKLTPPRASAKKAAKTAAKKGGAKSSKKSSSKARATK